MTTDDLRIIPMRTDDSDTDDDGDDETPSLQGAGPNDDRYDHDGSPSGSESSLVLFSNISLSVNISKSHPPLAVNPSSRRDSRASEHPARVPFESVRLPTSAKHAFLN